MMKDPFEPMTAIGIDRRTFLKAAAAFGMMSAAGGCGYATPGSNARVKIVIIGGGAAGISMASRLVRKLKKSEITLIDPADVHFYQPGFTLIASGVFKPDQVYRRQSECMPKGIKWVKKPVVAVNPARNQVTVEGGDIVAYDFLVLVPGLQLNWNKVEGITQKTLGGLGNAHCIYVFEGSKKTWPAMQAFVKKGGRGIFTDTYTKLKCGGAPKKICLLTEHKSRLAGNRKNVKIDYFTASKELYNVPFYTPRLEAIYREREISVTVHTRVKGVDTQARKVFLTKIETIKSEQADPRTGKVVAVEKTVSTPLTEEYDFLHFVPPQSAPDFVREAGLGWTEGKLAADAWAMVDKSTLVHVSYPNIVSLGDVAGIPTSKTGAAIRMQVPVAVKNLISLIEGKTPEATYDGYAACPIVTDYGHVLMCEFDYAKKPKISFPLSLLDMSKEQRAAWLLKVYLLKPMYFYGMLPGYC